MPRRRRRRRWWSPRWLWRHRSSRRRHQVFRAGAARKKDRRRVWPAVLSLIGIGLIVLLAWAYRDVRRTRNHLAYARDTLRKIIDEPSALASPQGRAGARAGVNEALPSLSDARRRLTSSPALRALGALPGLSTQRRGLLQLVDDGAEAANAGRELLQRADALTEATAMENGTVPVEGVRELERYLRELGQQTRTLVRTPAGLWGPVRDARRSFDEVASLAADRLAEASDAVRAALTFAGAESDRRHLLALQNNAEMRDQGMVLQYAVVRFSAGRLSLEGNGSVADLRLDGPASTPVPSGTQDVFGSLRPTELWQSVNATADFAFTGQAMSDMFRQATGTSVDGVIGIDVPGLAALLDVIGPVEVPGLPEPVSAENAARVLLHDLYEGLPPVSDVTARREKLGEVTRAVVDRLTHGVYDVVALGQVFGESAAGGHLRLWSPLDHEEKAFERSGLGGSPAAKSPESTFHLAVENRTATKLDYYIRPTVRQEVQLTEMGSAIVRTTVVVDNRAPVGAPPSYQLGPDPFTRGPGEYLAWLLLWGPSGATQAAGVPESGLVLSQQITSVVAGERREVTFETVVPNAVRSGRLTLRLVPQPRLEPVPLEVRLRASGWEIEGVPTWRGKWDQVLSLSWRVSR